MISCSTIQENICAYIDNELDDNLRLSFEEHVKNCKECNNELEEMCRIIDLCKSLPQQELPDDFNVELHEKLLAVAGRQEDNLKITNKSKVIRFVRTFAPIAAAVLLIFLAGNFFRFGFFSSMKAEDSTANMSIAAGQAEKGIAMESAPDSAEGVMNGEVPKYKENERIMSYSEALESDASTDADRSYGELNRQGISALDNMQINEAASNKISTITIAASDPDAQIEKINNLAAENNAETAQLKNPDGNDRFSGGSTEEAAPAKTGVFSYSVAETRLQLNFIVPDTNYDQFVTAINNVYGASNVQAGAFVTEDLTEFLNTNISRSDELDQRIEELENNDSVKNAEDIKKLKDEKENVDNLIEQIRLGTDFVNVTVYIDKKE